MNASITLIRRFLAVAALMFWLGGFTFYTSVAVPAGTEVLGSGLRQGFITRQVTRPLNLTGAVALGILAAEVVAVRDGSRTMWWTRAGTWLGMALCQAGLFWLHPRMDELLQVKGRIVFDPEAFRAMHRLYLWLHTIQWGFGVVFVVALLTGWRKEDWNRGRCEREG